MPEAIESRLAAAREARADGRPLDARNAYAQAAALSREVGAFELQAHALRHLSDLDREGGRTEQALAFADQAVSLYRAHPQAARLGLANALRLRALALEDLRRTDQATAAWEEVRDAFRVEGVDAGVAECEARLDIRGD